MNTKNEKYQKNEQKNEPKYEQKHNETILQPITCLICREIFSIKKRPLVLVCGHTFCELCLQNMFDSVKEIQCCLCKVCTKIDKFDDMIINFSILNLVEYLQPYVNPTVPIAHNTTCEDLHLSDIDKIDKLLHCIDCSKLVCCLCQIKHKNHKVLNIIDFINSEIKFIKLNDFKNDKNKTLINNLNSASSRINSVKSELEKIIKEEKENLMKFFKEVSQMLVKTQELFLHNLEKLAKNAEKSIEEFKSDISQISSDSKRYVYMIEEISTFKTMTNKQKSKILNIYNLGKIFNEVKNFNKDLELKERNVVNSEEVIEHFRNLASTCGVYKKKILKVFNFINKKSTAMLEKGYKLRFYNPGKAKKLLKEKEKLRSK